MPSSSPTILTLGVTPEGEPFHLNLDTHPHVLMSARNHGNRLLNQMLEKVSHLPGWAVLVLNKDTVPNLHIANQVLDALAEAAAERTSEHTPRILVVMENADHLLLPNGDEHDPIRLTMLHTVRSLAKDSHEAGIHLLISFDQAHAIILNAGLRDHFHTTITVGWHDTISQSLLTGTFVTVALPEDDSRTGVAIANGNAQQFIPADNNE